MTSHFLASPTTTTKQQRCGTKLRYFTVNWGCRVHFAVLSSFLLKSFSLLAAVACLKLVSRKFLHLSHAPSGNLSPLPWHRVRASRVHCLIPFCHLQVNLSFYLQTSQVLIFSFWRREKKVIIAKLRQRERNVFWWHSGISEENRTFFSRWRRDGKSNVNKFKFPLNAAPYSEKT